MEENDYILNILSGLGLAINEKNNIEIVINYPIFFNKKNMKYEISSDYKINIQPIGSFLSDFLNTDFDNYNDFLNLFNKYSLSLIKHTTFRKIFNCINYSETDFKNKMLNLLIKNKNNYLKLQNQTDMILDYCLLNPNAKAIKFKPIERLYVLRRISPNLILLHENRSTYYSINLFSSYPGKYEKEIYDFLSKRNNEVIDFDLILPNDISSILYKSICSILKQEVYLKKCKNCGKYFIATNKSYNYCDNIAPNQGKKTCRDIGRKNVFENNKNSDPIIVSYYKLYNRKAMMKLRYADIPKYVYDFDKFKRIGKKKLDRYKTKQITPEDFKKWIEKNS